MTNPEVIMDTIGTPRITKELGLVRGKQGEVEQIYRSQSVYKRKLLRLKIHWSG